jgi:hypothetical protein
VKTIKLRKPTTWIENGSETRVTEVTLREPTAQDLWDFVFGENKSVGQLLEIASRISDYPPPFFQKIGAKDAIDICDAVSDFLISGD